MSKVVRIGVIGMGRIGKLHINNLHQSVAGAVVEAVSDVKLDEALRQWTRSLGITKVHDDPEMILADPEVDAVFICSSTNTHADLIIRAAREGKDIFCEKPIDFDIERIQAALAASSRRTSSCKSGLSGALITTTKRFMIRLLRERSASLPSSR